MSIMALPFAPHLAGIPAHLLAQRLRLWVDDGETHGVEMTAEAFFAPQDPDVVDIDDIVATLLAGRTYRAGGGAEVEWTVRMATPIRWDAAQGWIPDREAACRVDIAHGLFTTLAEARAAFGYVPPGDVAGIVETIRRQLASCLPADEVYVERRTKLLVDLLDTADLLNEAERMADWVPAGMLQAAARAAVADLRGRL